MESLLQQQEIILSPSSKCDIGELLQLLASNSIVSSLHIEGNGHQGRTLRPSGAEALARLLTVNTSITSLEIPHNFLRPSGALKLAGALPVNTTLTSLVVSDNFIAARGLKFFIDALSSNTSITSLNLARNGLHVEGAYLIARSIQAALPAIQHLDLSGNDFFNDSAAAFGAALVTNSTLKSLVLSNCHFFSDGVVEIIQSLQHNVSLTAIDCSGFHDGRRGFDDLAVVLADNTVLCDLNIAPAVIPAPLMSILERNRDYAAHYLLK